MNSELILKGLEYFGTKEYSGKQRNNPKIVGWSKFMGFKVNDDETPNCSIFMNYVAKSTNHEYSDAMNAKSWLKVGISIWSKGEGVDKLKELAKPGDVLVFQRGEPGSWMGHVCMFINWTDDGKNPNALGANQGNETNIKPQDIAKLLKVVRLRKQSDIV